MNLSVAGGKGGTGKTSVALNLALSLGDVRLLDCDVEEPNCNIFLDASLEVVERVHTFVPEINSDKCTVCGECARRCQFNALVALPESVLVNEGLCHGCGVCSLVCPEAAIEEQKKLLGVVERGETDLPLEFYQGQLEAGEALAAGIIDRLKENHLSAKKTTIIDAPPGCNCAAVTAVESTDFCLLVTEPTIFGLHDLQRAAAMLEDLGVPGGVVVNREGFGEADIEGFCRKNDLPLLLKIPHDLEIARLYSKGIPFVNELAGWKEKFKQLFSEIEMLVQ